MVNGAVAGLGLGWGVDLFDDFAGVFECRLGWLVFGAEGDVDGRGCNLAQCSAGLGAGVSSGGKFGLAVVIGGCRGEWAAIGIIDRVAGGQ